MRRRWRVVCRVKQYPNATPAEVASLSPMLLAMSHELGHVTSVPGRCFTRWGARAKAARLNSPPSVMWAAVVERAA